MSDDAELRRRLLRDPALLLRCPSALAVKLEALSELMGSRADAAALARAHPPLLGLGTSALQEKWAALREAAGGSDEHVRGLVLQQGAMVLSLSADVARAKAELYASTRQAA